MDKGRIETAISRLNEQQSKLLAKVQADPYLVDWTDTIDIYTANEGKLEALMTAYQRIIAFETDSKFKYNGATYLKLLSELNVFLNQTIKHYV